MRVLVSVMALALAYPAGAAAQDPAELATVLGRDSEFLFGTRAAAARGGRVAVLTDPAPAVHVFGESAVREWGDEGQGPGELRDPTDLAWADAIVILDTGNRRIEVFGEDGVHLRGGRLDLWANRIDVVNGDTILGVFSPMEDGRAVVRLGAGGVDTLLSYEARGESVRLEADGAPSLTVKRPFTAQDHWSVSPTGELVWFSAESGTLRFRGADGTETPIRVAWTGAPVTEADREWWIASTIPSEFMGRPVFEPLRPVARREVEFPERLPPVLALEADPAGGVWVKRTTSASGEVWRLVRSDGEIAGELRFPEGRELLAVGAASLYALARDELDIETIEVYHRPAWAGGG